MEFLFSLLQLFQSGFSEFKQVLEVFRLSVCFVILIEEERDNGVEMRWIVLLFSVFTFSSK